MGLLELAIVVACWFAISAFALACAAAAGRSDRRRTTRAAAAPQRQLGPAGMLSSLKLPPRVTPATRARRASSGTRVAIR